MCWVVPMARMCEENNLNMKDCKELKNLKALSS